MHPQNPKSVIRNPQFNIMLGILNDTDIESILARNVLGRLGCTDGETIYVVPINYYYDGRYIFAHSTDGKKIRYMRKNPKVCFEVDEVENMMNWKTVITWGDYEEIGDELEKQKVLSMMVEKMMKLKVSETALPPHATHDRPRPREAGNITAVLWRIAVYKKTGRFEKN
jgi:uncharacterized protein